MQIGNLSGSRMAAVIGLSLLLTCGLTSAPRPAQAVSIKPAAAKIKKVVAGGKHKIVLGFKGMASWYGGWFHGKKTASGEVFDQNKLTAAHVSLPLGTKLLVKNECTGNSCVVKVNDRGPYVSGRVLDLSKAAANKLDLLQSGTGQVDCFLLGQKVTPDLARTIQKVPGCQLLTLK